jgi:hypothetical protein
LSAMRSIPSARDLHCRMTKTIVFLTHAEQGLDLDSTIHRIARQHWRPKGHRLLVHRGTGVPPRGALAIQHVDLTRLPPGYAELAAHFPVTINGAVHDISKRRISSGLIVRGQDVDGPVIVKTDLNHAGIRERQLKGGVARLREYVLRRFPASWTGRLPHDRYVVFDQVDQVPPWVWQNPSLVVQRLYVERRGPYFALNQWYFLGDRDCVSTMLSRDPLVKLATAVERLPLHHEVPVALRRQREALKFDYGKFDFIEHQDGPVLIDANRTPNEGQNPLIERVDAICAALAGGLASFLG